MSCTEEGLVEAEIVPDRGDHLRRRGEPRDCGGGISGHQVDHGEGDQADDQQDRHGAAEAPQDDAGHEPKPGHFPSNQTFDMRGMRNGTKPFTFARTACTLVSEPNGNA